MCPQAVLIAQTVCKQLSRTQSHIPHSVTLDSLLCSSALQDARHSQLGSSLPDVLERLSPSERAAHVKYLPDCALDTHLAPHAWLWPSVASKARWQRGYLLAHFPEWRIPQVGHGRRLQVLLQRFVHCSVVLIWL